MILEEMIDLVFSHNSLVKLWTEDLNDKHYSNLVWKGVAWEIPTKYRNKECMIFGSLQDNLNESDYLQIQIKT